MKPLTAVALSGGIDSLLTARLLGQQGYPVFGIHFCTGYETRTGPSPRQVADRLSAQLDIPVILMDVTAPFQHEVVNYFTAAYLSGSTPNPCMVCNSRIKFGTVLTFAIQNGAERLATGHYARIFRDADGICHLWKGADDLKDQSYFLARMTPQQFDRACFPLGDFTKSRVVEMAKRQGLTPIHPGESQDICFIRGRNYGEFLAEQGGFAPKPGPVVDIRGNIIGRHSGLHLFTIGQRRGINCPAAEPYYVIALDRQQNRLIVGFKSDLLTSSFKVSGINWIEPAPLSPIRVAVRVRYRSAAVAATLIPENTHAAAILPDSPQPAITPGQGAVFYQEDVVLGGGWIEPP